MIDLSNIKNPMDWRAIDRFILLASLVALAPLTFGVTLVLTIFGAPEYLNIPWALGLLTICVVHLVALLVLISMAVKKRLYQDDWPAFESFIIWGYIAIVLVTTFMAGTYLTQGLLMLFLGINITSALSNINKIRQAYWWVIFFYGLKTSYDLAHPGLDAVLFARPMILPDGSMPWGWVTSEILLALIMIALIYLCTAAFKRWGEREDLFKKMSKIDGLTQLTNRHTLIDQGDRILERGRRENHQHKAWVSCIMLDLDHFKTINDTCGHAAGDAVLVQVSKIMRETVRCYDEVGRYGGEEFCILLPSTPPKCAHDIAERLRVSIEKARIPYNDTRLQVTASLGVASKTYAEISDLNNLLKLADDALYVAKHGGRNQVSMASESGTASQTVELAALRLRDTSI